MLCMYVGFKEATIADGLAVPVVGPTSFEVARRFQYVQLLAKISKS